MKKFKGIVENITHSIVVDGKTYTTPVYNVKYTCNFNDEGMFFRLICDKHKGVNTIPHLDGDGSMCTGEDFDKIINEAYTDKELIHIVCERFFRQYNESDPWGTPVVLSMCGFDVYYWSVDESSFNRLLEEYDYYYINHGDPILKLTNESKHNLIGKKIYFIKKMTI